MTPRDVYFACSLRITEALVRKSSSAQKLDLSAYNVIVLTRYRPSPTVLDKLTFSYRESTKHPRTSLHTSLCRGMLNTLTRELQCASSHLLGMLANDNLSHVRSASSRSHEARALIEHHAVAATGPQPLIR